jgi:BclB C-terminal domain-containing protein
MRRDLRKWAALLGLVAGCSPSASSVIRMQTEAAGSHCEAGGQAIQVGTDADGDGTLSDTEVKATSYVCNGGAGAAGGAGTPYRLDVSQAATQQCAAGGVVLKHYADENRDGQMQAGEAVPGMAEVVICNGAAGTSGTPGEAPAVTAFTAGEEGAQCASTGGVKVQVGQGSPVYVCNGANGQDGVNGSTGAVGQDGLTPTVTVFTAGAEGGNCASTGGVKLQVGTNAPVYVCNGANGAEGKDGVPGPVGPAPSVTAFAAGTEGTNCALTGGVKVQAGSDAPVYVCHGVDGRDGADGKAGNDGADGQTPTVTSFSAGAEGTNCASTGGVKIQVGSTPPSYVCNGSNGSSSGTFLVSGSSGSMTTVAGGLSGNVLVLPLSGYNATAPTNVTLSGGYLDVSAIELAGLAQPFPSEVTLTGMAASFTLTTPMALIGSTVSVQAQLFTANAGSSVLIPRAGATVTLGPSFTGVLSQGTVISGTTSGLAIPLLAGTRAALVVSSTAAGLTLVNTVTGGVSAGLAVQ